MSKSSKKDKIALLKDWLGSERHRHTFKVKSYTIYKDNKY